MSVKPLKVGQRFFQVDFKKSIKKSNTLKKDEPKRVYVESSINNGTLDVNKLMDMISNKLDSMGNKIGQRDMYGENLNLSDKVNPVEVDFKKEIYINKAELAKLESEEVKGKVETKVDKLRRLRKQNGR
tara:strand:- start:22 stop:408 length:387 start_codon:yes stop_codon:yes gene_type:complete